MAHDVRAPRADLRGSVRRHPRRTALPADRAQSDPLRRQRLRMALVPTGLPRDGRAPGVGAILIAVGLGQQTNAKSLGWLYVYGVVRLLVSGFMTDREPESLRSLTRTGRIHVLLAGTAFASIAVAASHLDWTGRPAVLGPLGWLVTASAIATGTALVVPQIRRVTLGLIERIHYAAAITWLIVVAASII